MHDVFWFPISRYTWLSNFVKRRTDKVNELNIERWIPKTHEFPFDTSRKCIFFHHGNTVITTYSCSCTYMEVYWSHIAYKVLLPAVRIDLGCLYNMGNSKIDSRMQSRLCRWRNWQIFVNLHHCSIFIIVCYICYPLSGVRNSRIGYAKPITY